MESELNIYRSIRLHRLPITSGFPIKGNERKQVPLEFEPKSIGFLSNA